MEVGCSPAPSAEAQVSLLHRPPPPPPQRDNKGLLDCCTSGVSARYAQTIQLLLLVWSADTRDLLRPL